MVTLYKRATISQARMMRIVEGAVKNVADKDGATFDPYHARSIAKRAVGTLTAQMPEVLAATKIPSGWEAVSPGERPSHSADIAQVAMRLQRAHALKHARRVRSHSDRPDPLLRLERELRRQMWGIKAREETEKAAAFIEVLRMIAKLKIATV